MINIVRFGRLSDFINASSGYVRVRNAQLLRRNGDPTSLVLPELMVDQDEISFIAQRDAPPPDPEAGGGFIEARFSGETETRRARDFVIFTPGHAVTGRVHVFGQTDVAGFVDAQEPRFVAVTGVTARSLADRRVISHFEFILLNRTQMIAASEVGATGGLATDDVPEL